MFEYQYGHELIHRLFRELFEDKKTVEFWDSING